MSNRILVIYKSKTGFTKKYAQWLSEELPCTLVPYEKRSQISFSDYDSIVYGGSLYAGSILGLRWFQTKLPELTNQKIIVFATGASEPDSAEAQQDFRKNFAGEQWNSISSYYLPGGLSMETMGTLDRLLIGGMRKMVKKSEGENSSRYQAISHSFDHSSKEALAPIIQVLKEQM